MPRTLALLVGGNPLPNYLAARILAKERPWNRAVLFFTKQTERVKDRLEVALSELGAVEGRYVEDPGRAESIRDAWELPPPVHLHYTGGTKAMAVHLHSRWREAAGTGDGSWRSEGSYLDEGKEALRFDDGTEVALSDLGLKLSLELLSELHGLESVKRGSPKEGGPRLPEDAEAVARCALADPDIPRRLCEVLPDPSQWKSWKEVRMEDPVDLAELGLHGLSVMELPSGELSGKALEAWLRFLRGTWLEYWTGQVLGRLSPAEQVHVDVNAKLEGRQFQVDVVSLRRHRIYALSCTTDRSLRLCKSKLFEVAFRARQLGGDLARCALVCFLEKDLAKVRRDVEAGWDATNKPRAFGLQHLREWQAGRTESLTRWLES